MLSVTWIVVALICMILFYYVSSNQTNKNNTYGCNIEDDDIRREKLLSRIDTKKEEKLQMKNHLKQFLQEQMSGT